MVAAEIERSWGQLYDDTDWDCPRENLGGTWMMIRWRVDEVDLEKQGLQRVGARDEGKPRWNPDTLHTERQDLQGNLPRFHRWRSEGSRIP